MEGLRKRCFTWTMADGSKLKWCIAWPQWPTVVLSAYPGHPGPDPAPRPSLEIEGVNPEILRDLAILDSISKLSEDLSRDMAQSVHETVEHSMKRLQQKLPPNLSLTLED